MRAIVIFAARAYIGQFVYWLGYRIMPKSVRVGVSKINAIGLKWIEADCPKKFTIEMED